MLRRAAAGSGSAFWVCGRGRTVLSLLLAWQLRQLGDVGGDAPDLVTGEQLARGPSARFVLAIDEGQRLTVGDAHDEAAVASALFRFCSS
jgi:hypothetical protein